MFGNNPAHISHKLKGPKRQKGEDFKSYKLRMKKEKRLAKNYNRGELVWYPGGKRSKGLLLYLSKVKGSLDFDTAKTIIGTAKGTLQSKTGRKPVTPARRETQ